MELSRNTTGLRGVFIRFCPGGIPLKIFHGIFGGRFSVECHTVEYTSATATLQDRRLVLLSPSALCWVKTGRYGQKQVRNIFSVSQSSVSERSQTSASRPKQQEISPRWLQNDTLPPMANSVQVLCRVGDNNCYSSAMQSICRSFYYGIMNRLCQGRRRRRSAEGVGWRSNTYDGERHTVGAIYSCPECYNMGTDNRRVLHALKATVIDSAVVEKAVIIYVG